MRRVSKKRAVALRLYAKQRREYLLNHPWCVRCGGQATEIQHARGRVGSDLLNEKTWRAMCHGCHMHVQASALLASRSTVFLVPVS